MKKIVLTSLLAFFLAFPVFAQEEVENVTLPDAVMKQIVKRIITWNFKPRTKQTEIEISTANIKKEWLPKIKNIEFVVAEEQTEEPVAHVYAFTPVDKEGKEFSIGFGYRESSCAMSGKIWYFRVSKNRISFTTTTGGFAADCFP